VTITVAHVRRCKVKSVPQQDRKCENCALDGFQNEYCNNCSADYSYWRECGFHLKKRANRLMAKYRKALRAAQHDLITTTGLYCTDIVQDGVKLPDGFQLEHSSLPLVEKALKA
jgi:hypothetical protein